MNRTLAQEFVQAKRIRLHFHEEDRPAQAVRMKPFEETICREFKALGTSRGLGPKSQWIRQHLLCVSADFPYSMWRGFRRFSADCSKDGVDLRVGTYQSFRNFLRVLRRLNLIHDAKPWIPHSFEKHLIMLNGDKIDSQDWNNPLGVLYPSTSWKNKSREDKSEILRRARRRKGKKRGRPRK